MMRGLIYPELRNQMFLKKKMKADIISRRLFFKKLSGAALPILSGVLVSSVVIVGCVEETDNSCNNACSQNCTNNCNQYCTSTCASQGCVIWCMGSCSDSCRGSCSGSCPNGCWDQCSNSCQFRATGACGSRQRKLKGQCKNL